MNNNHTQEIQLRLRDLQEQSLRTHRHIESSFLNEEELAYARRFFPESELVKYDGGYEGARKQKVIFRLDAEDDFSDIVCIHTKVDQRFRKITHRDVLGSLMSLQIDSHSFGDLWIDGDDVYIYTTSSMASFLVDHYTSIANLNVSFEVLDNHPIQTIQTKHLSYVISSARADALVSALAHTSRTKAKEMIRAGAIRINHILLVDADEVCNNNCTVSIRGVGRFLFLGLSQKTKKDRWIAEFEQFL